MRFHCLLPAVDVADDTVHLLLELIQGVNLTVARSIVSLTESDVRFYLCELVLAVRYLHSLGVVHVSINSSQPKNSKRILT